MNSILVFDPGENTGWVYRDRDGTIIGGTCVRDHRLVVERFDILCPDICVFERFNLYPGMARTLSWNTFYPCEVIGVIRYICDSRHIPYVEQAPADKKYSGGLDSRWMTTRERTALQEHKKGEITEHMKDAYLHLRYYERKHEGVISRG